MSSDPVRKNLSFDNLSSGKLSSDKLGMTVHPTAIHPSAIIDPQAKVPASCKVGPYCVIGPEVELGENCHLVSHVAIEGPAKIGSDNSFFPFAAIGMDPQDVTYKGEPTRLEIGDHCMLVNGATLAGHVTVEEWAVVGALCPVHQFVRIGAHSYIGGGTTITQDVLPFSMTSAARDTHAYGMNKVGLERRGFSSERIRKIHHAYKILLASKMNTSQALEKMKAEADNGEDVEMLIRFIEESERGIIK